MPNVHCQKLLKIVAVSGRLHHPSKTEALLQVIINELGDAAPIHVHCIKFSEIDRLLGGAQPVLNQRAQAVQAKSQQANKTWASIRKLSRTRRQA